MSFEKFTKVSKDDSLIRQKQPEQFEQLNEFISTAAYVDNWFEYQNMEENRLCIIFACPDTLNVTDQVYHSLSSSIQNELAIPTTILRQADEEVIVEVSALAQKVY